MTQLDSVATNIKHTRGRMKSLSAGSSEDVDVGRLSPELNAVNTPIDTTQRAYLRRRSRSIIRSSTVEAWDEDDVEKTKRENDDKVKKAKKQPMDYKSLGIKFAGFHYTYVEDNPPAKVDEAILEYQFKLFTADDNDGKIWTPYNKAEESYASEHRALSRP